MVPDSKRLSLEKVGRGDLEKAAIALIAFAGDIDVWIFRGEMGAGKTTLIKNIGLAFQILDNVNSPTYSLVNEYRNASDEVFYHFDFYRIDNESEAVEIGVEDYFYSGDRCFVEWPSKIPSLIPQRYLEINMSTNIDDTREIDIIKHD